MREDELLKIFLNNCSPERTFDIAALSAMREAARLESIGFSEWCSRNYLRSIDEEVWYDHLIKNKYSTEELYNEFLKQSK